MINKVVLVILNSGEQLMGRLTEASEVLEKAIELENPLYVIPDATKVNTMPYLMLSKSKTAIFNDSHVRHVLEPIDELVDIYNKSFSKIAVPEAKKIIT